MNKTLTLCLTLLAAPLGAHPHIFVNTGLSFVVDDQNRLTHVQVTWAYDELYSLLLTEDLGVDSDYDGVLTAADTALLTGFDMQWIEGFNGDLVGTQGAFHFLCHSPLRRQRSCGTARSSPPTCAPLKVRRRSTVP